MHKRIHKGILSRILETMKTSNIEAAMTPKAFTDALAALAWKQSDFCRKSGVTKQTPSRWSNGLTPIPTWVPAYLGAMQEIKRLHQTYVDPRT